MKLTIVSVVGFFGALALGLSSLTMLQAALGGIALVFIGTVLGSGYSLAAYHFFG